MYLPILSLFIDQAKSYKPPVQVLNNLAVANMEKLLSFQIASIQIYADLGAAQLKAAAEVKDPGSFFNYMSKQSEYMYKLGAQVMADSNKVFTLATDFVSDSQKTTERDVGVVKKMPAKKRVRKTAA